MSNTDLKCPFCGASLTNDQISSCPYCGAELIDLSRAKTDAEISRIQAIGKETAAAPKKAAKAVIITLLILFLAVICAIIFHIPDKVTDAVRQHQIDRHTSALKKAYDEEDWDKLYELVIEQSSESLNSPAYFMYRTALFLHDYPPAFDTACDSDDTDDLLFIYELIASDYEMRLDDSFYRFYDTDDSIEEALKEEYERETAIMIERGLEDEMYKLRL